MKRIITVKTPQVVKVLGSTEALEAYLEADQLNALVNRQIAEGRYSAEAHQFAVLQMQSIASRLDLDIRSVGLESAEFSNHVVSLEFLDSVKKTFGNILKAILKWFAKQIWASYQHTKAKTEVKRQSLPDYEGLQTFVKQATFGYFKPTTLEGNLASNWMRYIGTDNNVLMSVKRLSATTHSYVAACSDLRAVEEIILLLLEPKLDQDKIKQLYNSLFEKCAKAIKSDKIDSQASSSRVIYYGPYCNASTIYGVEIGKDINRIRCTTGDAYGQAMGLDTLTVDPMHVRMSKGEDYLQVVDFAIEAYKQSAEVYKSNAQQLAKILDRVNPDRDDIDPMEKMFFRSVINGLNSILQSVPMSLLDELERTGWVLVKASRVFIEARKKDGSK